MDDGLQNASLRQGFHLAVVDGRRGIGNARVFPAGPLRAPLAAQLARSDALLVVGDGRRRGRSHGAAATRGLPVLHGKLMPDAASVAALKARQVLAFAGIGDPEKFFATAREAGIEVAQTAAFPDHHRFTAEEAGGADHGCRARGAGAAHHREGPRAHGRRFRSAALAARAHVLPVTMEVREAEELQKLVAKALRR